MYRLICPVVDLAASNNGLEPFFEFSQPNGPNKRLSADIALIRGEQPVWLIEAKKFTQSLHPDLVAPYLKEGVMGVVTNGSHWVFVVRGQTAVVGPLVRSNGSIDKSVQEQLVELLSLVSEDAALQQAHPWSRSWAPIRRGASAAVWRLNEGTGSRELAETASFESLRLALQVAEGYVKPDSPTAMFLEELRESGAEIGAGTVQVSSKRLIWWLPTRLRGARINLESWQVEMLVLNNLLESVGRDRIKASIKLHDKNHAMSTCKASTPTEIRSLVPLFGAYTPHITPSST